MKGSWEELPASPCSGASSDSLLPNKPLPPPPHLERARKRAKPDPAHAAPCASLSAEDERRKVLLERLRAIDAKKATLRSSPASDDDDDEVVVVAECKPPARRSARGRFGGPRKAKKPAGGIGGASGGGKGGVKGGAKPKPAAMGTTKGPAKQIAQQVIDVDDDEFAVVVPRLAKGKPGKAKGKGAKTKDHGLPPPQRVSSRIRRRRTPNALDEDASRPAPMPTCMTKCRRLQFCKKLVSSLLRDPSVGPFSAPVNELWPEQAIPRYFDVITKPMDLRTVKKMLDTTAFLQHTPGGYLSYEFDVATFEIEVARVFDNARLYNRAGDNLYNAATNLKLDFQHRMRQLPAPPSPEEIAANLTRKRSQGTRAKKDKEVAAARKRDAADDVSPKSVLAPAKNASSKPLRRKKPALDRHSYDPAEVDAMGDKELRTRLRHLQECRVPVIARTPVPKGSGYLSRAALLYDIEMTWQEKNRLKDNVEKVPETKLEAFITMIKRSSNDAAKEESHECFELDMDTLNNVCLRNIEAFLEEFVPGFKTVRCSILGREFTNVADIDEEIDAIRKRLTETPREKGEKRPREPVQIAGDPKSFFGKGRMTNDSSSESSSSGESDSDSSDDSDESDRE